MTMKLYVVYSWFHLTYNDNFTFRKQARTFIYLACVDSIIFQVSSDYCDPEDLNMPAPENGGGGGGVPRASLICRPNSHPFQDRMLGLDQPVKVGRSVARARPQNTNAIFDCKVNASARVAPKIFDDFDGFWPALPSPSMKDSIEIKSKLNCNNWRSEHWCT